MKTLKEQTEAKVEAGRTANPSFMAGVDAEIAKANEFEEGKHALKVGQQAMLFELPNQEGKSVSLNSLLESGPVILTFYRGDWCPYCNLQLRALQERLSEIKALGATLVAISPQVPDDSLTKSDISNMNFTVLSDQNAVVASKYGVAWKVPEFLLNHMRVDRNLNLAQINNGNAAILPIPATFILDMKGTVVWTYVNVDYRTRSEPEEIIKELQKLS